MWVYERVQHNVLSYTGHFWDMLKINVTRW